jgi:hypothetical protein
MTNCDFAEISEVLDKGRICRLDNSACFNYDKLELVKNCPTLKDFQRGELVGKTPAMDYREMPHVVRTGKYGNFVTGMPPEYLTGNLRAKKKEG